MPGTVTWVPGLEVSGRGTGTYSASPTPGNWRELRGWSSLALGKAQPSAAEKMDGPHPHHTSQALLQTDSTNGLSQGLPEPCSRILPASREWNGSM